MRAMEPREAGYATNPNDGVRSYYEQFGPENAERTVLALPTWSLVHSRCWKMQVPYLAHAGYRVITFDGRGNGRSDIPDSGYTMEDFAGDAMAVLEHLDVERASLLAFSSGGKWCAYLAGNHEDRFDRAVMIAPAVSLSGRSRKPMDDFLSEPPHRGGWNRYNAVHWREDLPDFTEWFGRKIFSEPHSTKGADDIVEWSTTTTPESLIATVVEGETPTMPHLWPSIRIPILLVHGSDDQVIPLENSLELQAANPNVELFVLEDAGHAPQLRDPVKFNLEMRDVLERPLPEPAATSDGSLPKSLSNADENVDTGRTRSGGVTS